MIRINGRGAVYGELWYDEELPGNPGVDIVLHRQRTAPIADVQVTPFLSLVIDFSVKKDAIADGFGETCRYEIRRAETKDGLSLEFTADPETRLDEFRAFFDAFARQKSLAPADPPSPALGFLFQKQGKRLPGPGRAGESVAPLENHAAVQGDGHGTLRLGRPFRRRIRSRARRNQQLQEKLRRTAGTDLRLHAAGDVQRPDLSPSSSRLAPAEIDSGLAVETPAAFLLNADTAAADRHGPVAHGHGPDAVRVAGARRRRRTPHAQERDELHRGRRLGAGELAVVLRRRAGS